MEPQRLQPQRSQRAQRKHRVGLAGIFVFFVSFVSFVVQGFGQSADLRLTKVREHLFMVTGAGGNVAVLIFPEGITVVDSGRADMSDKLVTAIRTLSPLPIRYR